MGITKGERPAAELTPVPQRSRAKTLFDALKGTVTFAPDFDPGESALDPDWEEQWEASFDGLLPK